MEENKYGVEVIKKSVDSVGKAVGILYEVFVEKKGLWHLIGLQGVVQSLLGTELAKVKLELSDLSEAEREDVMAGFKLALPAAIAAKVGPGVDLLEEAIDLVEDGISFVKKSISDVQAFIAKAKALLGVA